jgi:hypothetical protein
MREHLEPVETEDTELRWFQGANGWMPIEINTQIKDPSVGSVPAFSTGCHHEAVPKFIHHPFVSYSWNLRFLPELAVREE